MTIKKSLITTDWRAKGLKGNPGSHSFRICFLLLILMMVSVAAVSAAPVASSISPASASYIGGKFVTITGTGFSTSGATTINFNNTADSLAYYATSVTVLSATTITANVPAHPAGIVDVQINNNGEGTVLSGAFTYTGASPTFTGMNTSANTTPNTNAALYDPVHNVEMKYIGIAGGALVNLSGSNLASPYYVTFGSTQNATTDFVNLTVNNIVNDPLAGNGFNLTMKAPSHDAGTVSVTLTTPNGSVSRGNLTYVAQPVITGVSPAYGSTFGGGTITITGTGDFGSASSVFFNQTQVTTFLTKNTTAVTLTLPNANLYISPTTPINITTVGGDSTKVTGMFTYYDPPAIDAASAPATGQTYATSPFNVSVIGGTTVTIYGKNFTAASMSGATVKFNGTAATSVTRVTDTSITAVAPAWPYMTVNTLWQSGNFINIQNSTINVTTLGGISKDNFGNITYDILKPNITSVSPISGSTGGGNVVTITGKNLSYASKVYFFNAASPSNLANTTAGVTVVSDTQITCIAPPSTLIGAVQINVTTPAGFAYRTPDTATYTYSANIPSITTVSPTFGPDTGQQWVNITGTGFSGMSAATFNGVAVLNSYVFNDTTITLQTPPYPLGGASFIAISAAGGSVTQQNAYTFAGIPHITSISPVAGSTAGGSAITITGTNLTRASVVRFNVTQATIVGTPTATSVTATLPAANGSATGPVNVNVSTWSMLYGDLNGVIGAKGSSDTTDAAGSNAFNYGSGPTLTSISPASGSISGGTLVTLKGANLANATSVTFGGIPATNFTRFDTGTQITANTPATTTPGVVYPLILTPSGSVTNASVGYTYYGSPVITSITPPSGPTAGGNFVTITGTSFVGASQVTFDGIQATNFTYVDSTKITANAPAHAAGAVTVLVAATGGTGTGTYTYSTTTATAVGVFRSGTFYLNGVTTPVAYGLATDTPITGKWNAGSATNVGVFRSGTFYLNGVTNPVAYGLATDTPVTGDWNGDGITEVGVFRSGTFYLNGVTTPVAYGLATDTPITGDWNADGITEVGVFRSGTFYLNGVTTPVAYGLATDTPITGKWV